MAVVPVRPDFSLATLSEDAMPLPRAVAPDRSFADLLGRSLTQSVEATGPALQEAPSPYREQFLADHGPYRPVTAAASSAGLPVSDPPQNPSLARSGGIAQAAARSDSSQPQEGTSQTEAERHSRPETDQRNAVDRTPAASKERTSKKPDGEADSPPDAPSGSKNDPKQALAAAGSGAAQTGKVEKKGAEQKMATSSAAGRELTGALPPARLAKTTTGHGTPEGKSTDAGPAPKTALRGKQLSANLKEAAQKHLGGAPKSAASDSKIASSNREPSAPGSKAEAKRAKLTPAVIALAGISLPAAPQAANAAKKENSAPAGSSSNIAPSGTVTHAKSEQAQLTVIDMRGAAHHDPVQAASDSGQSQTGSGARYQDASVRLIQLESGARSGNLGRTDGSPAATRQEATAQLQQNWGTLFNQVVRGSGIVLREGGSGEIRLVLKPEHLGSVRVRLEMNNNEVSGRIVVDNQAVRQLFQQNLEALYRAFQESGFGLASLDVSVGGRDRGEREKGAASPLPMDAVSARHDLAHAVPDLPTVGTSDSLVNMFV